jgi:hypothetical protein
MVGGGGWIHATKCPGCVAEHLLEMSPDEMERIIQRKMEASGNPEAMDQTAASTVEELRDQRDAGAQQWKSDTRNRRRNDRKKKKKGKKK